VAAVFALFVATALSCAAAGEEAAFAKGVVAGPFAAGTEAFETGVVEGLFVAATGAFEATLFVAGTGGGVGFLKREEVEGREAFPDNKFMAFPATAAFAAVFKEEVLPVAADKTAAERIFVGAG
jgi:hypothetical protein